MTWQKILIIAFALAIFHVPAASAQSAAKIMKTKHDTVKNLISNVR